MQQFFNYISSRRFAIYILLATTAIILFSTLLPNINYLSESEITALRVERPLLYEISVNWGVLNLVKKPLFQIIPLFLFLSISVCTIKRLALQMVSRERKPAARRDTPYSIYLMDDDTLVPSLLSLLKLKGWKTTISEGERALIEATKGESGIWGSFIFHMGMNVFLIGFSVSALTGVRGVLKLTEGFTHSISAELRGVPEKYKDAIPLKSVKLESFEAKFKDRRFPVEYISNLLIADEDSIKKRHQLKVNHPLRIYDYDIIFSEAGFSPRLILKGEDGSDILDAVVNMEISMPGIVDVLSIPDEGLNISVQLFPDYLKEGDKHSTKGEYPFNPYLYVEIDRWGKQIGNGFLQRGKPVKFDRYSLEFRQLHHWVDIVMTKDQGVKIVFAGFIIVIFGLILRLILNEKRLWVLLVRTDEGTNLRIGGRCSYFPSLFEEELASLVETMGQKLGKNNSI